MAVVEVAAAAVELPLTKPAGAKGPRAKSATVKEMAEARIRPLADERITRGFSPGLTPIVTA